MAIIKRSMGKIMSIVDTKEVHIDDEETREAVVKASETLKPKALKPKALKLNKLSVKEYLEK